jgi:hypothetical protein
MASTLSLVVKCLIRYQTVQYGSELLVASVVEAQLVDMPAAAAGGSVAASDACQGESWGIQS